MKLAKAWAAEATALIFPLSVLQEMHFCTHNSEETTLKESYCLQKSLQTPKTR